jgi:hypothetical protein
MLYAPIHFIIGVDGFYYARSWMLVFFNFCFCVAFYIFIQECDTIGQLFKKLVSINFLLVIIALCLLPFSSLRSILWYLIPISPGIESIPRLKLFTSEAAVYSIYLVPLVLFYFFKSINNGLKPYGWPLLTLLFSLALSFSMGVISTLFISLLLIALFSPKLFFGNKNFNQWMIGTLIFCGIAFLILLIVYPENPLFRRISNILNGTDTSSRGRTYEAFIIAMKILKEKSSLFGIGLGQIKVIGRPIILQYYEYTHIPEVVRIPNALAETLVYFGFTGLIVKLGLELFLFFKTKVYTNYYRLSIFIFIFIYQFTGSYFTNIAEYVLWIIAFTNSFTVFNYTPLKKQSTA